MSGLQKSLDRDPTFPLVPHPGARNVIITPSDCFNTRTCSPLRLGSLKSQRERTPSSSSGLAPGTLARGLCPLQPAALRGRCSLSHTHRVTSPLQASKPDHQPRQGSAPGRGRPGDRACGRPTPRSRGGGFPSSPSHTLQTQRQLLYTNPLPPPPRATVLVLSPRSQVLLAPPSRSQCQGLEGLTNHAHCKGTEAAPMGTLPHTSSCAHSLQGPRCPLPTVGSRELRWAEGPGRCRKDQEDGLAPGSQSSGGRASSSAPGAGGGAQGDPSDRETVAEAVAAEPGHSALALAGSPGRATAHEQAIQAARPDGWPRMRALPGSGKH